MPRVIVVGGGLAGLAAAAALGSADFEVDLFEARPYVGGRAASYALPTAKGEEPQYIDNCQHVLLRCCVNLLNFYERLEVGDRIEFHRDFYFLEPGGRVSVLSAARLPVPLHFAKSFARLKFLNAFEKVALARGMAALRREYGTRKDLDRITMAAWLREKKQPERVIDRFWRQVLVSAVNEEIERMAAIHAFQVFWKGFLARRDSYEMGVPASTLGELYASETWHRLENVRLHLRAPVDRICITERTASGIRTAAVCRDSDFVICALPFERVPAVAPELELSISAMGHSPITGIHLWFDRPVTDLPHATLLGGDMQWFFNKHEGRYLQLVVSASRKLLDMSRNQILELARRDLEEFLPAVRSAQVVKAHVVKEVRATFSATPASQALRADTKTKIANLFLAGDWTQSGWPATMEGAVRSGYLAAEAVAAAAGVPQRFLVPDLA